MDGGSVDADSEMKRFAEVWGVAAASLCYCYLLPRRLPAGPIRLLFLLPVVALLAVLPLRLSSIHLVGAAFFFLTWLANSKLLLLALGLGPLSLDHISFLHFVSLACLPIKTQSFTPATAAGTQPKLKPSTFLILVLKSLALAVMSRSYRLLTPTLHPYVLLALCCFHLYFLVELVLALSTVVPLALGLRSMPQFDEPYLATSLEDFWGRRWNIMASDILRQAVYNPMKQACGPAIGRGWAAPAASVAAFIVSGMMHELMFYHLTRAAPTWEVTWFFVLQGVAMAAEKVAKRRFGWRLHRSVSGPLAVGFVMVTSVWLFWPQLLRNGVIERTTGESATAVEFVMESFPMKHYICDS